MKIKNKEWRAKKNKESISNSRERRLVGDTTIAGPVNPDITSLSPTNSPWVFNDPVLCFLISYSENTVVKSSSTVGEDTWAIGRPVGSVDCDRDGLFNDSSLKIFDSSRDSLVPGNTIDTLRSFSLIAGTVFGCVGVDSAGGKGVLGDISESFSHLTSIATETKVSVD